MFAKRRGLPLAASLLVAACGGDGEAPNNVPVAQALDVTTLEDSTLEGVLVASDPDGTPLTFEISARAANGIAVLVTGGPSFAYVPDADFFGRDSFTYTVSDGKAEASALVSIEVESVNDLPVITAIQGGGELKARSAGGFSYADADGPIPMVSVTQVAGPPVPDLQHSASSATFTAPDVQSVQDLVFEWKVTDDAGVPVARELSFRVFPLSPSGALTTILGSPAADGIHWVVAGDGYTSAEMDDLRAEARAVTLYVLDTEAIRVYKPLWNVHVLEIASAESGIDIPAEGILRDTAFAGEIGCLLARSVCVNNALVFDAVVNEQPASDLILVILNTELSGGAGGAIAVVTADGTADTTTHHELGHTFAGLGDEYIDEEAAPLFLPGYSEDAYPNVTRLTDPEEIKWRHWFSDPQDIPRMEGQEGVGLFEGAFYHAQGFFRPVGVSFMRSSAAEMGPVNVEAWAKAVYRSTGVIRAVSPASSDVAGTPGMPLEFEVIPVLPDSVQEIRWFIDGAEAAAARNLRRFVCCDDLIGAHTVEARVRDGTGNIRDPDPDASEAGNLWNVTLE